VGLSMIHECEPLGIEVMVHMRRFGARVVAGWELSDIVEYTNTDVEISSYYLEILFFF